MKMRITSAAIVLLMLFSLLSFSAAAEETDGLLRLSDIGTVAAGSSFTLKISPTDISKETLNYGLNSVVFELEYDHSLIEADPDSIKVNGYEQNWEISPNFTSTQCVLMLADVYGKQPIKENGAFVVEVVFNVKEEAVGKDVKIEATNVQIGIETPNLDSGAMAGDSIIVKVADKSSLSYTADGATYYVNPTNNTASLVSVEDKTLTSFSVPSTITYEGKTLKVVSLESNALSDLTSLTKVYVPCTVKTIPSSAFSGGELTITGCKGSTAENFATNEGYSWAEDTSHYIEKTIKPSTCTEAGQAGLVCPDCGTASETKELPLADHTFGEWVTVKEPTDNEDGSRERTCSVCGTKETEAIPKLNCEHPEKKDVVTKEPTCSETGSKNIVCAVCGKVLEENVEVAKLEHTFGEWVVTKEATITAAGSRERTCSVCGIKDTETIPKLQCPHTNTRNSHLDPTCTANGYDRTICRDCGALLSSTTLNARHTEGPIETKAPTCTEEGYTIQKCTVCGEVLKNEVVPAEGHSFGEWTVLVPATTSSEGTEMRTCTKCGFNDVRIIEKLPPVEESSEPESVPPLKDSSTAEESSRVPATSSEGESGGGSPVVFIVIGVIVLLITIAYIVIMAINKRRMM